MSFCFAYYFFLTFNCFIGIELTYNKCTYLKPIMWYILSYVHCPETITIIKGINKSIAPKSFSICSEWETRLSSWMLLYKRLGKWLSSSRDANDFSLVEKIIPSITVLLPYRALISLILSWEIYFNMPFLTVYINLCSSNALWMDFTASWYINHVNEPLTYTQYTLVGGPCFNSGNCILPLLSLRVCISKWVDVFLCP